MSTPTKRRLPRGCGCLLIPVAIIALYYSAYFFLRGPRSANPQLIAHRGGRATTPENTLVSFSNAIAIGADYLEFDVQMTADGRLVVIHDETVGRTTNGTGPVREMTLEQIRAIDAGNGERVPTFEEVIQLAKDHGVDILPEAKSPDLYPGMPEQMVRLAEEMEYLDHTVFQSFVPAALDEIRAANDEAATCPLFGLWKFDLSEPPAEYVCPMAEMVVLNPWMVRSAHARGQQAYIWFGVIEHPLMMRLMLAFGADGVIVDDPAGLAKVMGR